MSADNTIAVFHDGNDIYVGHVQAVDDYLEDYGQDNFKSAKRYFLRALEGQVFTKFDNIESAMDYAKKLHDGYDYVEYGICEFDLPYSLKE